MDRDKGKKPLIGVTGPDRGGLGMWLALWFSVHLAGGRAARIRPGASLPSEELDGLILGGGADVDPGRYGQEALDLVRTGQEDEVHKGFWERWLLYPILLLLRRLPSPKRPPSPDPGRDSLESSLLAALLKQGKPVLGICRGAQLLNIHMGGDLYQNLAEFYTETAKIRTILPRKTVTVAPGTLLASIIGQGHHKVNALHNQAIHELGDGLAVSAREAATVIQAIESRDRPFLLGVQWHPEFMPQVPTQRAIFRTLTKEAAGS